MYEGNLPLMVGIPGTVLDSRTRAILEETRPWAVVLFARNLASAEQARELVTAIRSLDHEPLVAVDLEGGTVNRVAQFWGRLPSAKEVGRCGVHLAEVVGSAAGAACRSLGIALNLAPVVDLETEGGILAKEDRCLAGEASRVRELASAFLSGLNRWNVGGCLKHFPGLGAATMDTHKDLPRLDLGSKQLEQHMEPFSTLSERAPAVMVGHVVLGGVGSERPASMDPAVLSMACALPGNPVVLTDDMDMGAVSGMGELWELAEEAFVAGAHGVLICSSWDALPETAAKLRERSAASPALEDALNRASVRMGTMASTLSRKMGALPAPDFSTVSTLFEEARREAER